MFSTCICVYHIFQRPAAAAAAAKSLQSCLILCNPIDCSPPGSTTPGILQARTLEWFAISFSSAWKWKVKVKSLNGVWLFATPWTAAHQAPPSMGLSRQEYWSGLPLPSPQWHASILLFICAILLLIHLPMQEKQVPSLGQEDPLEKKWQSLPVFLPRKTHGQRSFAGYSPWDHKRVRHNFLTKQQQCTYITFSPLPKNFFRINSQWLNWWAWKWAWTFLMHLI